MTKIEWVKNKDETQGRTWNPVTGCSKTSAGCQNCYAERMAKRLRGRYGYDADEPFKVTLHPDRLSEPLKWRKPQMVFVCSMGDLFHEDVPDDYIHHVYDVMETAKQHTFIVCTKRPERLVPVLYDTHYLGGGDYLPNVWHLCTAENQEMADKRIPELLKLGEQSPGWPVLGVSVEPMLGVVDLTQIDTDCKKITLNSLTGIPYDWDYDAWQPEDNIGSKIDWVICGSESGPKRRPMKIEWARDLKNQCVNANIPFFLKQMEIGGKLIKTPELDGQEWNQRPEVKQSES